MDCTTSHHFELSRLLGKQGFKFLSGSVEKG